MLQIPETIRIVEVGPRDGLQSLPQWIDTDVKVQMIDRLSALGLPTIEVSSFAHPKVVPNLRDAEEVFARIHRTPGIVYRALVPNAQGAQRAVAAKVGEMLGLMTLSDAYTQKNQNMSVEQAIDESLLAFRTADKSSIPFVMALGMAFWCAYEGSIPEERVRAVVARLYDGGVRRFYLAGSLGMEDPAHVSRLFGRLIQDHPGASFGFHIHNLSGMATANIVAALDAGVDWLESAICGIGGGIAMPKELGAVGNFPTEDLIAMLSVMGVKTGIDLEQVVETSSDVARMLAIAPQSHAAQGATRKNVMKTGRKV
jgi:hydroxymethylglutaryl-CoA lyase